MPDATFPLIGQPPFEQYTLTGAYDEMFAPDGSVRPAYAELARRLRALSPEELQQRQRYADLTFLNQGITSTIYGNESGTERVFPYDLLPRMITADE